MYGKIKEKVNINNNERRKEISGRQVVYMKFRRIDDTTVRCIVSKEDMQEYGIVLEDFFKNKGKIHDFLHVVVEKAEEEVGYEPKDGMLSMQIMPLSQSTIAITFSETANGDYEDIVKNIKENLPGLAGMNHNQSDFIDGLVDFDAEEDDEEFDEEIDEEIYEDDHTTSNFHHETGKKNKDITVYQRMVIFMNSLDELSKYCKAAGIDKTVKSDLYWVESRKSYCLIIEKKRLSMDIFRHLLVLATEFTTKISDSDSLISYIREHGDKIIEKKAYRILRKHY